jgi:hypothetical protein
VEAAIFCHPFWVQKPSLTRPGRFLLMMDPGCSNSAHELVLWSIVTRSIVQSVTAAAWRGSLEPREPEEDDQNLDETGAKFSFSEPPTSSATVAEKALARQVKNKIKCN